MSRVNWVVLGVSAMALVGCLETAGVGGTGGGGGAAFGGGAAVGDGAFARDENGCLVEMIAGQPVAIVGPDGRPDCG